MHVDNGGADYGNCVCVCRTNSREGANSVRMTTERGDGELPLEVTLARETAGISP